MELTRDSPHAMPIGTMNANFRQMSPAMSALSRAVDPRAGERVDDLLTRSLDVRSNSPMRDAVARTLALDTPGSVRTRLAWTIPPTIAASGTPSDSSRSATSAPLSSGTTTRPCSPLPTMRWSDLGERIALDRDDDELARPPRARRRRTTSDARRMSYSVPREPRARVRGSASRCSPRATKTNLMTRAAQRSGVVAADPARRQRFRFSRSDATSSRSSNRCAYSP